MSPRAEVVRRIRSLLRHPRGRRIFLAGSGAVLVLGGGALSLITAAAPARAPAPVAVAAAPPVAPRTSVIMGQAPSPRSGQPNGGIFQQRNPFGLSSDPPPEVTRQDPPPPPPPGPPPGQGMNDLLAKLTLRGTFINPARPFAVIQDSRGEGVYRVGQSVEGARIVKIDPRMVTLAFGGNRGQLQLKVNKWDSKPEEPTPAAPAKPAFQASSSSARRLPRSEVDHHLENLSQVISNVSLQPFYQGGRQVGFKLNRIQRGSIFGKLGLQNGDVIRFINGQKIDSVQSAYQVYNILRDSTNVEITVLRDTRPVVMRYLIY